MKKIAVFSFFGYNYGTVLQLYALYSIIKQSGNDADYIEFIEQFSPWRVKLGRIKRNLLGFFRSQKEYELDNQEYWNSYAFRKIKKKIDSFVGTEMSYKQVVYSEMGSLNERYDIFLVGSDQIWSVRSLNENSPALLGFVKDNKKKASYAPSFGTTQLDDSFIGLLKRSISDFHYLSCRERSNALKLTSALSRSVFCALDPTLLLNNDEWTCISSKYEMPKKYILCYILGEKKCIAEYAENLGEKCSLPVYFILTRPFYKGKKNLLTDVGPREFLDLISNCSCLVTDSFHGIIFSINFSKPFYAFNKREGVNTGDNDRIKEILKEFNLSDRFVEDGDKALGIDSIEYKGIQAHLSQMRKESMDYLDAIINN